MVNNNLGMNGQWWGDLSGSSDGWIIVNIDDMITHYQGRVFIQYNNIPNLISTFCFATNDKKNRVKFNVSHFNIINKQNDSFLPSEDLLKKSFPNVKFPKPVDVSGLLNGDTLSLSLKTDIGDYSSSIPRSQALKDSNLVKMEHNWDSFKEHVCKFVGKIFLFRGQNKPYRLRTPFHRTGRADVVRFWEEDIKELQRHLSAQTTHVFDLNNPSEIGAFFNLVQHHGYPTPLLDWTFSPYVAAYFAYRGIDKERLDRADNNDYVRIISFDAVEWSKDFKPVTDCASYFPHLTVGTYLAIENERMIPQQAASTMTNIDDIETFVLREESNRSKKYLQAIDLPVSERNKVLKELRFMGITAGSMFPSIDGLCEGIKEKNFELA